MSKDRIKNSRGTVFYGMHFYPGVAEYAQSDADPYRIFINEDTIRKMGPTFAGKPVFVEHVDEVESKLDKLRTEADGWVIESFFNSADGKHWVKFIVVSERGEKAVRNGFRLSNCYIPKGSFGNGGLWNGVSYAKQVNDGEYEHLAIVKNPRYEESVIMTPDEFKAYNENLEIEIQKLANSKGKESTMGKFTFFKREKIENGLDLESTIVLLPKSKKEVSLSTIVNEADEMAMNADKPAMVKVGNEDMKLEDLIAKFEACMSELKALKEAAPSDDIENEDDVEEMDADAEIENEEDKELKAKDDEKEVEAAKKKNAADAKKKENLEKLKNARKNVQDQEEVRVDLMEDQVARGKSRYGSN